MQAAAPVFEAVLYPNQSLSRSGSIVLMGAVSIVTSVIALVFVIIGAWPVSGFFGLDLVILYWAFSRIRRSGRRRELIRLDRQGLVVRRFEPDGRSREWRFEPYWAQVHMDDPPRRHSRLTIAARGARLVIGDFLTPEERLDLARTLDAVLRGYR